MIGHAKVRGGATLPWGDPRVTNQGETVNILFESEANIFAAIYDWDDQGPVASYGIIAKQDLADIKRTKTELTDEATWPQMI